MNKEPHGTTKHERQSRLLEIVRSERIATQEDLVARLHAAGVDCTQASVSRDVRELGLVKHGGHYAAPESATAVPDLDAFAARLSGFLLKTTIVGEHLVVVHTLPGTAHTIGLYIDGMAWPGVAGNVAGDDTVFVAVFDRAAADRVAAALDRLKEDNR